GISWDTIEEHLNRKDNVSLNHFIGSTPALFLAALNRRYDKIIAVLPESSSARFLRSDLEALQSRKVTLFPPSGQKPYDDQQITDSQQMVLRSEALENIVQNKKSITVTSAEALAEKIISSETFAKATMQLDRGDSIVIDELKEELVNQQYENVKFVNRPGEFAHRGGIVDVFPYSSDYPVRLEFFGNEIDSIREFDADSQRSVSHLEQVRLIPDATNLQSGPRRQLLSYVDEDAVIVLFDKALIKANIKERFSAVEKTY